MRLNVEIFNLFNASVMILAQNECIFVPREVRKRDKTVTTKTVDSILVIKILTIISPNTQVCTRGTPTPRKEDRPVVRRWCYRPEQN